MSYATRARPPRTLTVDEVRALLRATGEHSSSYRDHMLFSMALGTGLRESELLALDCGDVVNGDGGPVARLVLRVFKRCTDKPAPQEVMVPDKLRHKLARFLKWKKRRGESIDANAPLFVARGGRRLSDRRARELFGGWLTKAGLSSSLSFHSLRHTFCQRLYEDTRDIRVVQRAARHADMATTTRYAQPSDEYVARAVEELDC